MRFLSWDEVCEMPPPEWLIEGVQPQDALSCIYGPPGIGKSFIALDQALCVATGTPWLGHPVKQGPVIYIAAEGARGLAKRMEAWREFRGLERSKNFAIYDRAVQLLQGEEVAALVQAIEKVKKPPVLVVFDTFSRCLVGGNENAQEDVGLAVAAMNRVQRCCGATVLVLHHTGRNGEHERGSTVLPGALEASAFVSQAGKALKLECKKQKDWQEFDPIGIRLVPFAGSLVPTLADVDPLSGIDPFWWAMLARLQPLLEGEGSSMSYLLANSGASERTFHLQVSKFATAGVLQKSEGKRGLWTVTDRGRELLDLHFKRMREDEEQEQ